MNYKKKANITLTLVALGFITFSILKCHYNITIVKILFYMSEAALIGGMADWFAVTAIFRKPLGFPFHTAIVPRNRVAIVNSIVNIVETEFLSAEIIGEKLDRINITDKIINWTCSKAGKDYLRKNLSILLRSNIEGDGPRKLSEFVNSLLKDCFDNVDLNKYLNDIFVWSLKSGEYKKLLSFIFDDIIKAIEGPDVKNKIYVIIDNLKAEKTQGLFGAFFNSALENSNLVNIGELADSIHMHLIETFYNLKDEEHEATKYILGILEEHLILNASNPLGKDEMENIKLNTINNIITENLFRDILINISNELEKLDIANDSDVLNKNENESFYIILDQINRFWNNLKGDEEIINKIEKLLKDSFSNIINREHKVIGKIVKDTLDSFSDDNLNKFIEDRAGNDLQWIRINGSIVGGMVGLLVFLFLNYFYDPIAVPFIQSLFR